MKHGLICVCPTSIIIVACAVHNNKQTVIIATNSDYIILVLSKILYMKCRLSRHVFVSECMYPCIHLGAKPWIHINCLSLYIHLFHTHMCVCVCVSVCMTIIALSMYVCMYVCAYVLD